MNISISVFVTCNLALINIPEPPLSKLMYMLHSVDSNRKLMVDSVTGPDKFITLITEWVTAYKSMGLKCGRFTYNIT